MKRLVVCCDGTWNNPEQEENGITAPTNVVKLYNALADEDANGTKQLRYYHPGLGGEDSGIVDEILGGALGVGIGHHISSAYHWLGSNYEEGDEIYLYGFSRGAFTARSLGGMLSKGLLDLRSISSDESWKRVKKAYETGYRKNLSSSEEWAQNDWNFFNNRGKTPIHFIGVWDTVGALGVPDDLEILNFFDDKKKWQFHDTTLGSNVRCARHAMAMDEIRSTFSITRWTNASECDDALEVWFPGVHSDVGGGYAHSDLSYGALRWMMDESRSKGLMFRESAYELIYNNPLGVLHNSYKGIFSKLRSRPRNIPEVSEKNRDKFHESVFIRQKKSPLEYPQYHQSKTLEVGESLTVEIFADTKWNHTQLYLGENQSFTFWATGKWVDSKDVCDWRGTENDEFTMGDIVRATSSFLGKSEAFLKRVLKNESMDIIGTKRVENMRWFTMVGALANDAGESAVVGNDGSAVEHQYVDLTQHETIPLVIKHPAYLYCFANDVWSLYENNHGSVHLTVTRKQ